MRNTNMDAKTTEYDKNEPRCSVNDIKKLKAKKFYNKNNKCYWVDNKGFFYEASKDSLPTKKSKEEYKMFGGNPNAVWVCWGTEVAFLKYKWFSSMDEFLEFFKKEKENQPKHYGTLYYKIKKKGYTKLSPEDRKVIFKLPYFDIDKTIKELSLRYYNENYVLHRCAELWCKEMEKIKFFEHGYENFEQTLEIIKKYLEWKDKNEI